MHRSHLNSTLTLLATLATVLAAPLALAPPALARGAHRVHAVHAVHSACVRPRSGHRRRGHRCSSAALHSKRPARRRNTSAGAGRAPVGASGAVRAELALSPAPAVQTSSGTAQAVCENGSTAVLGPEETFACSDGSMPRCENGAPEKLSSDGTMLECGESPGGLSLESTCDPGSCTVLSEGECEDAPDGSSSACEVATVSEGQS